MKRDNGVEKADVLAQKAKAASDMLAHASTKTKNKVLERLEQLLAKRQDYLVAENRKDIRAAEKGRPGKEPHRQTQD